MGEGIHQYDLCRLLSGRLVVVVQNDILSDLQTRVVIPLLPPHEVGRAIRWLNPTITIGEQILLLAPEYMAAMKIGALGQVIGNISGHRDAITRALDTLVGGV